MPPKLQYKTVCPSRAPPARMMKNQICNNLVIRQSMLQVICCYKCCLLSNGCGVFNHKLKNHIIAQRK